MNKYININNIIKTIKQNNFIPIENVIGQIKISRKSFWRELHCYAAILDKNDESKSLPLTFFNYKTKCPYLENLKNGDTIIINGTINYYNKSGRSEINIICSSFRKLSEPKKKSIKEETRIKVQKLGYFNKEKKDIDFKKIKNIALLTSLDGDVIHDIINNLKEFNGSLFVYNCNVQGDNCSKSNIKALNNLENIDLVIIARGGGSEDDLDGYNDFELVKSVYECSIPIITAIGHTKDKPLICEISDINCITPTEVSIVITKNINTYYDKLKNYLYNMNNQFRDKYYEEKNLLLQNKNKQLFELLDKKNQIKDIYNEKLNKVINKLENNLIQNNFCFFVDGKLQVIKNKKDLSKIVNKEIEFRCSKFKFKIKMPQPYDICNNNIDEIKEIINKIKLISKCCKLKDYNETFLSFYNKLNIDDDLLIDKIKHHLTNDFNKINKIDNDIILLDNLDKLVKLEDLNKRYNSLDINCSIKIILKNNLDIFSDKFIKLKYSIENKLNEQTNNLKIFNNNKDITEKFKI